jgi:hypothetical protein
MVRMGRAADAAAAARELPGLAPDDPAVLLHGAHLHASCAALDQRHPGLSRGIGLVLSRAYQGEAVAPGPAGCCKGSGGRDSGALRTGIRPVRNCDDFRVLLHEVNIPRQQVICFLLPGSE